MSANTSSVVTGVLAFAAFSAAFCVFRGFNDQLPRDHSVGQDDNSTADYNVASEVVNHADTVQKVQYNMVIFTHGLNGKAECELNNAEVVNDSPAAEKSDTRLQTGAKVLGIGAVICVVICCAFPPAGAAVAACASSAGASVSAMYTSIVAGGAGAAAGGAGVAAGGVGAAAGGAGAAAGLFAAEGTCVTVASLATGAGGAVVGVTFVTGCVAESVADQFDTAPQPTTRQSSKRDREMTKTQAKIDQGLADGTTFIGAESGKVLKTNVSNSCVRELEAKGEISHETAAKLMNPRTHDNPMGQSPRKHFWEGFKASVGSFLGGRTDATKEECLSNALAFTRGCLDITQKTKDFVVGGHSFPARVAESPAPVSASPAIEASISAPAIEPNVGSVATAQSAPAPQEDSPPQAQSADWWPSVFAYAVDLVAAPLGAVAQWTGEVEKASHQNAMQDWKDKGVSDEQASANESSFGRIP